MSRVPRPSWFERLSVLGTNGGHPLGPLVLRVRAAKPARARVGALASLAACGAVLGVALWLQPDSKGYGTHRQLGFPPCGMVVMTGYPCPSCGMTTAFAHAARGRWLRAFHAQPAGLVLAWLTMLGMGIALDTLITARTWRINWFRVDVRWLALACLALLLLAWGYKITTTPPFREAFFLPWLTGDVSSSTP